MARRLPTAMILSLLWVGCAADRPADPDPGWNGAVRVDGALRAMFHQQDTGAKVTLDTLLPDPDLYAVGALAGLTGEITVIRGEAYLSYPEQDGARTEVARESAAAATLLVGARVPRWRDVMTEAPIPFDRLDDRIGDLAATAGMDLDRRIPFLLEGEFEDLRWHVIDGRRLTGGGTSHEDHLAAAVQESRERATATLVGFYSRSDQGVFTHRGSTTHLHCVLERPLAAGHVDHVVIPAGTIVRFPVEGIR